MPGNFLHRGLQRRTDGYAIGLYLKAAVIGAVVGDGQFNLSPLFFSLLHQIHHLTAAARIVNARQNAMATPSAGRNFNTRKVVRPTPP